MWNYFSAAINELFLPPVSKYCTVLERIWQFKLTLICHKSISSFKITEHDQILFITMYFLCTDWLLELHRLVKRTSIIIDRTLMAQDIRIFVFENVLEWLGLITEIIHDYCLYTFYPFYYILPTYILYYTFSTYFIIFF